MTDLVTALINRREKLNSPSLPLVVFDIDSTLMDTEPRNRAILKEALAEFPGLGKYFPEPEIAPMGWNFLEGLKGKEFPSPDFLEKIHQFWEERFFTDEYVLFDRAYQGAAGLLHGIAREGFTLVYLTGRHERGMSRGTEESFRRAGFPLGGGSEFLFKPEFSLGDLAFKEESCRYLLNRGSVTGTFDNEPGNCNLFARFFPGALNFWVDTITSPHPAPLDPSLLPLKGFL